MRLFFNATQTSFTETLGVLIFHRQLLNALISYHEVDIYIINDDVASGKTQIEDEWWFAENHFVTVQQASNAGHYEDDLEILIHQFQTPVTNAATIQWAFDLHVTDLLWKYEKSDFKSRFCKGARDSRAVVTMFPRTYCDIERELSQVIPNLFLVPSPLLNPIKIAPVQEITGRCLLYPAQLQAHKNHIGLLEGVRRYIDDGGNIDQLYLTGSSFSGSSFNIHEEIATRDLNSYVSFLGKIPQEEFSRLYQEVHGIIVPSLAEGGCYVGLEAIAAGRPVALNRIRSAEMHLRQFGGEVLWFDSESPTNTAQVIDKIFDTSPTHFNTLNSRARDEIERTTWKEVASMFMKIAQFACNDGERPLQRVSSTGQVLPFG